MKYNCAHTREEEEKILKRIMIFRAPEKGLHRETLYYNYGIVKSE
jgi:hypothetical protein